MPAAKVGRRLGYAAQRYLAFFERMCPAQVADIADVVRQRADALMLSGESAAGAYPEKAVGVLRAVATRIEEWCRRGFTRACHTPLTICSPALLCLAVLRRRDCWLESCCLHAVRPLTANMCQAGPAEIEIDLSRGVRYGGGMQQSATELQYLSTPLKGLLKEPSDIACEHCKRRQEKHGSMCCRS